MQIRVYIAWGIRRDLLLWFLRQLFSKRTYIRCPPLTIALVKKKNNDFIFVILNKRFKQARKNSLLERNLLNLIHSGNFNKIGPNRYFTGSVQSDPSSVEYIFIDGHESQMKAIERANKRKSVAADQNDQSASKCQTFNRKLFKPPDIIVLQ
ncbi:hypothetical protein BDA99DRAFT_574666 [Phascolomyces articulosus]|uniref:Uncharacterized protein n=1 Tax=Phascolomyces articulosus TaxID=60185 RepID=A0AAD5K6V6_9FUNG|nr:hypothetical protein BDA99DRAFT_574666 [Phascolomyces articulosus]